MNEGLPNLRHRFLNKKVLIEIIAFVILIAVAIGAWAYFFGPGGIRKAASYLPGVNQSADQDHPGQCSGKGPVTFGTPPMRLQDIGSLIPLGLMTGGHVTPIDHMYYYGKDQKAKADTYPVYAIANGVVKDIGTRTHPSNSDPKVTITDHRVWIQYTCDFYSYFDLATSLSPKLQQALDRHQFDVPIKEGEIVAYVGGQTLDFGVYNWGLTLPGFVNPSDYDVEKWKVHTDDPFKYFKEPLRSQLLVLDSRQAEPRGGKIDYDIDGKLVGNWFKEGTKGYEGDRANPNGYWVTHLAFAYDDLVPSTVKVSIGSYPGGAAQFCVIGNTPDPATIGITEGLTKYQLTSCSYVHANGSSWDGLAPATDLQLRIQTNVEGTFLTQLQSTRKLKFEVFAGKTAAQVSGFDDQAVTYER